jgi:hypothetical protein
MRMPSTLLKEFIVSLGGKAGSTVEAYQRELRHFLDWISRRAGNSGPFNPQQQLTKTALQTYMAYLQSENHSISHCARVCPQWAHSLDGSLRRRSCCAAILPAG